MKTPLLKLLAITMGVALLCSEAFASSTMISVHRFKELEQKVNELGLEDLPKTLVVMDDDDTLTMMGCQGQTEANTCQYLGGPAWFSWQSGLAKDSPYCVANSFEDLLKISSLLLAINDMVYTEHDVPTVLNSLTGSKVHLLVLTARGPSNSSATARQFADLPVTGPEHMNFLELIRHNSLIGNKSQIHSIASPFIPCDVSNARSVSYQQGIMYVAGQNKGEMLKCLLNSTESSSIKHIFFIDDTLENVKDVHAAFEDSKKYNVIAIHYMALEAHKKALTKGPMAETYQNNAKGRWDKIKKTLDLELENPALP
ncbi:MAG: DUF2608 domain-containing protein [Candidatus Scalindua sp.]|nr:DUF2608 domain-containing protein [Candidatus Scalindua sp.]